MIIRVLILYGKKDDGYDYADDYANGDNNNNNKYFKYTYV